MPAGPGTSIRVNLTSAQRRVVADILPYLADRLSLDEPNQRTVRLSPFEFKSIQVQASVEIQRSTSGMKRNSARHLLDLIEKALARSAAAGVMYQVKITLLGVRPTVWRVIQVRECTLDELHEHIQTAMGWTNSHLHSFQVGDQQYGDPDLLDDGFNEIQFEDSTTTKISDIMPKGRKKIRLMYEYDFGDCWRHEVVIERKPVDPSMKYPVCVDGKRACPPEDVGGTRGYTEFLAAIRDPRHEQHKDMLAWVGRRFDPEAFDAAKATRRMQRGLPDWRRMRW